MDEQERAERVAKGRRQAEWLASRDVAAVAVTFVDTSGITRVKGVPVSVFDRVAGWGVGATPVFDAFLLDDSIAATPVANPAGDLRLLPDLQRLVPLAAQPGWAWAPADRWTQEGQPHPGCARLLAARMIEALAEAGLTAKAAFEVEFVLFRPASNGGGTYSGTSAAGGTDSEPVPAVVGPAYGMTRLIEASDFAIELLRTLAAEGVAVQQIHPEYAPGQLELSVAAESPLAAADTAVLVRSTIRAVAARRGLAVSFAPAVLAGGVGNGGHLHLSLQRGDRPLFAGGDRRYGLTGEAEAFMAGVLERLPALLAVGAPSVASYLRLVPSHWAGAYACWGLENREAALRLVTGSAGEQSRAANFEIKCFDQSANPYLAVAAVLAAGLAGLRAGTTLPEPVQDNPASLSEAERAEKKASRLPEKLADAVAAFEADKVLTEAFGPQLTETVLAVRRAEIDRFADASPEEVVAATRWRH
jgi:glutamine synthetase